MSNGLASGTLEGLKAARARYQTATMGGGTKSSFNIELGELEKEVIELIDKIEKGIATEADKRRAESVKNQLEYRSQELDFTAKMYESRSKNVRAQLDARTKILVARETAERRYNEKVRTTDSKLLVQIETILAGTKGQDSVILSFDALMEPEVMGSDVRKPKIAPDDPKYGATLASMMVSINRRNKANIFVIDPVTKLVDITKTKNNLSSPKLKITSAEEVGKIERWLQYYNASRRRRNQHEGDMARLIQESQRKVNAAGALLDAGDEDKAKILLNEFDELDQQRAALYSGFHSIKAKSDLDEIVAESRKRSGSLQSAKDLLTAIQTERGAGGVASYKRNIAKAIANPNFRAWAADYGWDRLGQVQRDSDGNLDLTTYVQGGDDYAALLAWGKQSGRRAGNYGTKRIRTGEVLRVELRDGTIVTGARLKRHSADPLGAIRIVQPDGARLLLPEEVSQAIYLQRPTPDPTRIDRRAQRIYEKEKDQYMSLEVDALRRGDFEDRADLYRNEEGQFAVNEAGEYLNRTQVSELRSATYNASGYHVLRDDESKAMFVVAAEGNVFPLADDLSLGEQLTAEQAKVVLEKLPTSDTSRLLVPTDRGGYRSFTAAEMASAIQAGRMPKELQVFGYMEPEQKTTAAANMQLESEALTDSDLGLGFGDGPTGIDPTVLGKGQGETGIFFRDLVEGEDFPLPDEDPPETPVEQFVRETVEETAEKPFDEVGVLPPGEQPVGAPGVLKGSDKRVMDRFVTFSAADRATYPDLEAALDAQIAAGTREPPADYVPPRERLPPLQPGNRWQVDWRGEQRTAVLLPDGKIAIYSEADYEGDHAAAFEDMQRSPNERRVTGGQMALTSPESSPGQGLIEQSGRRYEAPEPTPKDERKQKREKKKEEAETKKAAAVAADVTGDVVKSEPDDIAGSMPFVTSGLDAFKPGTTGEPRPEQKPGDLDVGEVNVNLAKPIEAVKSVFRPKTTQPMSDEDLANLGADQAPEPAAQPSSAPRGMDVEVGDIADLSQAGKILRGLFKRRKKKKTDEPEETPDTTNDAASDSTVSTGQTPTGNAKIYEAPDTDPLKDKEDDDTTEDA